LDGDLDLTDWVEKVCRVNTHPDLNAKAIPAFLAKGMYRFISNLRQFNVVYNGRE